MLVFLICVREIYALDIELTGKEVEAHLGGEFNRSYDFFGDISAIGAVELNHWMEIKAGVSVGWAEGITDIKIFTNARFNLLKNRPFGVGFSWMYNGLPEYETHSHTLLPLIYYNAKYWGIIIGTGFSFTSYFHESAIFNPTLSISVYANFINNEKLRIGVSFGNYNDFQVSSHSLYSLCFNSAVRINRNWSVLNEFEIKQNGFAGFTTTFYGIALRGGARFTW